MRPHAIRGLVAADQTCSAHTRLKMPQRFAFPSCDKRKSCTKAVRARGRPCREARRALIKKRRDAAVAVDDAHLAADHIDQLREGVDTAVPKELSHPRRFPGPSWHSVFGIVHEGAEFQHLKTPAGPSDARLSVEDRTRALTLDGERDKNQHRRGERQQNAGNHPLAKTPHLFRGAFLNTPGNSRAPNASHDRNITARSGGRRIIANVLIEFGQKARRLSPEMSNASKVNSRQR